MLKAVPLALMLSGVWRRSVWASMLILLYVAEGVVRGMTDCGLSARLGWLELLLAAGFFAAALAYVAPFKRTAKQASKQAAKQAAKRTEALDGDTRPGVSARPAQAADNQEPARGRRP